MKTLSLSPNPKTYEDLVATLADLRQAGYALIIANGRLMLDFPTLLLENNSSEEELQKMCEISAELNILCQELGIGFICGTKIPIESMNNKVPTLPDNGWGDVYTGEWFAGSGWKMEPWGWKGFKGNPTDNETWKPKKARKGYGHNKLKGKKK